MEQYKETGAIRRGGTGQQALGKKKRTN